MYPQAGAVDRTQLELHHMTSWTSRLLNKQLRSGVGVKMVTGNDDGCSAVDCLTGSGSHREWGKSTFCPDSCVLPPF